MSDRDDQKARYQAYAHAARNLEDGEISRTMIRVPEHPTVWETEAGAFVEAAIWIPRWVIEPPLDQLTKKLLDR